MFGRNLFCNKKILILSPHVDDLEYSCGGLVSALRGVSDIYSLTFSFAEDSLPPGFSKEKFAIEMIKASNVLGIKSHNITNKNYKVREFSFHRQSILDDMVTIREKVNPDIIILPNSSDTHQDHKVIHDEGLRAFRFKTILGYESLYNDFSFKPSLFFSLTNEDYLNKIAAIKCYQSQLSKNPHSINVVKASMAYMGSKIKGQYAEAFEVIRIIG